MTLEQEKDDLKAKLIDLGYFKTPDGRQLYQLSFEELEFIYKNIV